MTIVASSAGSLPARAAGYRPGQCNIGPTEIAARRRAGHLGILAAAALLAILIAIDADPIWRLLVFLPAAGAATGYLQAALRFCAGFGLQGVFNFSDQLRDTRRVESRDERTTDRRKALQILGIAGAIGAVVAVVAFLLPL